MQALPVAGLPNVLCVEQDRWDFDMRTLRPWALASAGLLIVACGAAPVLRAPAAGTTGASPPEQGQTRPAATPPYLADDPAALFAVLPPAPVNGDARDAADRRIFRDTRSLEGSPRWQMAADDAELGNAAMLRHFACSLDIAIAPQQAPKLVALLQKSTREAAGPVGKAKDFYQRLRPFKVDAGPTCVPAASIGDSYDYPSGHATAGWAWALVLSQVDPPHAAPVLARGRAIGDSRVVCGMHNSSAVEGARDGSGQARWDRRDRRSLGARTRD
jgi:acid phosphatase (class A)